MSRVLNILQHWDVAAETSFSHNEMQTTTMQSFSELKEVAKDVFTNVTTPWLPSGAQAIYGGTFITHALTAAQKTVHACMSARSIHCTFLLGGKADAALNYHVSRLSTGPELAVREVRTYQQGKCLFIANLRFSESKHTSQDSPKYTPRTNMEQPTGTRIWKGGMSEECPFVCSDVEILRDCQMTPVSGILKQWMKTGRILPDSSAQFEHLVALAYMSDNYLLPTASRLLNIFWDRDPEYLKHGQVAAESKRPNDYMGRMLTLSHTLHFHAYEYRADDWLMAEMRLLWIGDGRALVGMQVFSQTGVLLASAQQEGIFRLQQASSKL